MYYKINVYIYIYIYIYTQRDKNKLTDQAEKNTQFLKDITLYYYISKLSNKCS